MWRGRLLLNEGDLSNVELWIYRACSASLLYVLDYEWVCRVSSSSGDGGDDVWGKFCVLGER